MNDGNDDDSDDDGDDDDDDRYDDGDDGNDDDGERLWKLQMEKTSDLVKAEQEQRFPIKQHLLRDDHGDGGVGDVHGHECMDIMDNMIMVMNLCWWR